MRKTTILNIAYILVSCFLSVGCINFKPNQHEETTDQHEETTSTDGIESNPQDDALMENSDHLKFKKVPIDGTLDNFVSRMKRNGFKVVDKQKGIATLSGDFADYKECTVYVETLDRKDLVARISVTFPPQDQWGHLYGDYKYLKELLIEKYGKPSSCTEKFQGPYGLRPTDDADRMFYVKQDNCKYNTKFKTSKGEIALAIGHDEGSSCYVTLVYKDKINGSIIKQQAKDDL